MNAREDRLLRTVALAIGVLPEPVQRRIAVGGDVSPSGVRLDGRIAALTGLTERAGRGFRPDVGVAEFRTMYAQMNRAFGLRETGAADVREVEIATDDGTIGGRLYRPAGARETLPLLVYFHGGGFAIGDVPGYDGLARFFAVHKVPHATRTLQQTLERIDRCAALRPAQPATLTAWLESHGAGAAGRQ